MRCAQVVKLYAWEPAFASRVYGYRNQEHTWILKYFLVSVFRMRSVRLCISAVFTLLLWFCSRHCPNFKPF